METKRISHWIDGKPWAGVPARSGDVFDPATGTVSGRVDFAAQSEVDEAVSAASRAFATWRHTSLAARSTSGSLEPYTQPCSVRLNQYSPGAEKLDHAGLAADADHGHHAGSPTTRSAFVVVSLEITNSVASWASARSAFASATSTPDDRPGANDPRCWPARCCRPSAPPARYSR